MFAASHGSSLYKAPLSLPDCTVQWVADAELLGRLRYLQTLSLRRGNAPEGTHPSEEEERVLAFRRLLSGRSPSSGCKSGPSQAPG